MSIEDEQLADIRGDIITRFVLAFDWSEEDAAAVIDTVIDRARATRPASPGPYEDWTADELRSEVVALVESVERLTAERDDLKDESDEYDRLLSNLGELLTGVADALKGEPPALVMHDWSDLPAVADAVVGERDVYKTVILQLDLAIENIPPEHRHEGSGLIVADVFNTISRAARGIREGEEITDG